MASLMPWPLASSSSTRPSLFRVESTITYIASQRNKTSVTVTPMPSRSLAPMDSLPRRLRMVPSSIDESVETGRDGRRSKRTSEPLDRRGEALERQHVVDGAEGDRLLRHAEDDARTLVLRE